MLRKFLRYTVRVLAVLAVVLLGLFLYLRNADLSTYQAQFEAWASGAIGHELGIDGRFELHVGGETRVLAERVSLRNPDWTTEPELIAAEYVSIAVDTWSLFHGPLVVEELEVRGVSGRMERDAGRHTNWESPRKVHAGDDDGDFDANRIAFRHIRIDDVRITYADPARPHPLVAVIESLSVTPDNNDILDLDLRGTVNDLPLWADGKLGPWQNFLDGKFIDADLDLTLGTVRLSIRGSAEDLPYLQGISADATLTGPDAGRVIERLGLPPFADGSFELTGQVSKLADGHQVRVEGQLGAIDVLASGAIDRFIAPQRAALDFSVGGPDTHHVAELFGIAGAPTQPFRVSGDFGWDDGTATFTETLITVGDTSIEVTGTLEFAAGMPDGRVALAAHGPDFAVIGPFVGIDGLPREAFDVRGEVIKDGALVQVNDVAASVGPNRVSASGSLTIGHREDSEVVLHAEGPDISVLRDFTGLQGLPERPFDILLRLRSDPAGIRVDEAKGKFGDNRLAVQGVVTARPGFAGTSLGIVAAGPELQKVALLTGIPHLPKGPFSVTGTLSLGRDLLRFDVDEAAVGELTATASGDVGFGGRAGQFDVEASVDGPDTAQFVAVDVLRPFDGEPFTVAGRVRRAGDDLEVSDLRASTGGNRLTADGLLKLSPLSNDSDLQFSIAGASLRTFGRVAGVDNMVDKPFGISGQFTGTPSGFAIRNLSATIGDSDLNGEIAADLHGKPRITGTLNSANLDISDKVRQLVENSSTESEDSGFMFSAEPIDFGALQASDIELELRADRLRSNTLDVRDFHLVAGLNDGELRVGPFGMSEGTGRLSGFLRLSPVQPNYELQLGVDVENLRVGLAETNERDELPPLNGRVELRGAGVSLHEIMATANGFASARQGSGRIGEFAASVLFQDMFLEVLRAIDPTRKQVPYRTLDCTIVEVSILDGVATLEKMAMQTDRMLMVAGGSVDFRTELLNLSFRAIPREGVGVSLGTIVNSLIGVRGTLKKPKISIDAEGSVKKAGAAVLTGGFSLLARGLWDRLSAEKSVCEAGVETPAD